MGVLWASRGWIWMTIGGNQADVFPDLPIQPQTLDFHKKNKKNVRKTYSNTIAEICFQSGIIFNIFNTVRVAFLLACEICFMYRSYSLSGLLEDSLKGLPLLVTRCFSCMQKRAFKGIDKKFVPLIGLFNGFKQCFLHA